MKGRFVTVRLLCLFITPLFLLEYLEPSTIGVRADFESPLKQERTEPRGAQGAEESPAAMPHAMLFSAPSSLETLMIVRSFRPDPTLPPPQCVSSTIYRPPLAAR